MKLRKQANTLQAYCGNTGEESEAQPVRGESQSRLVFSGYGNALRGMCIGNAYQSQSNNLEQNVQVAQVLRIDFFERLD